VNRNLLQIFFTFSCTLYVPYVHSPPRLYLLPTH
jgi:hypothetical protein